MPIKTPKKLIEVALPLDDINAAAAREKSICAAGRELGAATKEARPASNQPQASTRSFPHPPRTYIAGSPVKSGCRALCKWFLDRQPRSVGPPNLPGNRDHVERDD